MAAVSLKNREIFCRETGLARAQPGAAWRISRRALRGAPTKLGGHIGVSAGSTTGGQIGGELERPNLDIAAERLSKLDNDEAWLNCKRVAMDFGVFVPADPN